MSSAPCGGFIGNDNTMNACVSGWTYSNQPNYCNTNYSQETQPDEFQACSYGSGGMNKKTQEAVVQNNDSDINNQQQQVQSP